MKEKIETQTAKQNKTKATQTKYLAESETRQGA